MIFSIDCETNGLYGEAFAVAAVVTSDTGTVVASFLGRCPIDGPLDKWVAENVWPKIEDVPTNFSSAREMRDAFWAFWLQHRNGADVVAHIGHPVETGFFRTCVADDSFQRMWDGPFPLHEVATALRLAGEEPISVDAYIGKHGLTVPFDGSTHHPMYDAHAAAVVWRHLRARFEWFECAR